MSSYTAPWDDCVKNENDGIENTTLTDYQTKQGWETDMARAYQSQHAAVGLPFCGTATAAARPAAAPQTHFPRPHPDRLVSAQLAFT